MHQTIEALESAIATLETYFQSIVFDTEAQASAVARRLRRAETRLNALTFLCTPEDANDQR